MIGGQFRTPIAGLGLAVSVIQRSERRVDIEEIEEALLAMMEDKKPGEPEAEEIIFS